MRGTCTIKYRIDFFGQLKIRSKKSFSKLTHSYQLVYLSMAVTLYHIQQAFSLQLGTAQLIK